MKTTKPETNPDNTQKAGSMTHLVRLAVDALCKDIADRRGLKWEWEKIDEDVIEDDINPRIK